jgi:hypothetical protein
VSQARGRGGGDPELEQLAGVAALLPLREQHAQLAEVDQRGVRLERTRAKVAQEHILGAALARDAFEVERAQLDALAARHRRRDGVVEVVAIELHPAQRRHLHPAPEEQDVFPGIGGAREAAAVGQLVRRRRSGALHR